MSKAQDDLAAKGEELAWRYLKNRGYRLLARNFRTVGGEVDLVVEKGKTLVFVEVKTRRRATCEEALEAVDEKKRARMARAANRFLKEYRGKATIFRFDVVTVLKGEGSYRVMHFPEAFELEMGGWP